MTNFEKQFLSDQKLAREFYYKDRLGKLRLLVLIADPHLPEDITKEQMDDVILAMASQSRQAEIICCGGDWVSSKTMYSGPKQEYLMNGLVQEVDQPVIVVQGNHDVRTYTSDAKNGTTKLEDEFPVLENLDDRILMNRSLTKTEVHNINGLKIGTCNLFPNHEFNMSEAEISDDEFIRRYKTTPDYRTFMSIDSIDNLGVFSDTRRELQKTLFKEDLDLLLIHKSIHSLDSFFYGQFNGYNRDSIWSEPTKHVFNYASKRNITLEEAIKYFNDKNIFHGQRIEDLFSHPRSISTQTCVVTGDTHKEDYGDLHNGIPTFSHRLGNRLGTIQLPATTAGYNTKEDLEKMRAASKLFTTNK